MSIEMKLATDNKAIARNILEGYTRTGGKNWSRIAMSTGRDWKDKENGGFVAFFVNQRDLGVKSQVGGLTFIARDQKIENLAIRNMDEYVAEESRDYGTIAFWSKTPHIHNWFDKLSLSITGEHIRSYIMLQADVLHKLRDDCDEVLRTDREQGRNAGIKAMGEKFPLTGEAYEMFSPHTYTQKYFDDLEETRIFLDHLFTLEGAEDARYAYDPYF